MENQYKKYYDILLENEMNSGSLRFRFTMDPASKGRFYVYIDHINGCNWDATYFLSEEKDTIQFHLINEYSQSVNVQILADDSFLEKVYQTPKVAVMPLDSFLLLLQKRGLTITWKERC